MAILWSDNTIMYWWDANLVTPAYRKVTDHGRQALTEDVERIETKTRMADGTMRKYTIAKKRTWSTSWDNLPSTNSKPTAMKTADGGMAGEDIQAFHNANDGAFLMQLRRGDGTIETVNVMISEFSKEVNKRGTGSDLWTITIALEEV